MDLNDFMGLMGSKAFYGCDGLVDLNDFMGFMV